MSTQLQEKCLEWTGAKTEDGYGMRRHSGKVHRVHRLEWAKHNGPIPAGMVVMHKCDNPSCYNIKHLSLGTQLDNIKDRDAKGRHRAIRGEQHSSCKLSDQDIRDIRAALLDAPRGTQAKLARKYRVSDDMISRIKLGSRRNGEVSSL